mmetsp:Transcript_95047/g.198674  ORF Transcript_95047/g.198674 Transcript_95047/m.198674 type:complete len:244 (+) Transcript_95047:468-1199(+)
MIPCRGGAAAAANDDDEDDDDGLLHKCDPCTEKSNVEGASGFLDIAIAARRAANRFLGPPPPSAPPAAVAATAVLGRVVAMWLPLTMARLALPLLPSSEPTLCGEAILLPPRASEDGSSVGTVGPPTLARSRPCKAPHFEDPSKPLTPEPMTPKPVSPPPPPSGLPNREAATPPSVFQMPLCKTPLEAASITSMNFWPPRPVGGPVKIGPFPKRPDWRLARSVSFCAINKWRLAFSTMISNSL